MDQNSKKSREFNQGKKNIPEENKPLDLKKHVPPLPFEKKMNSLKKEVVSQKKSKNALAETLEKMNQGKNDLEEMVQRARTMAKEVEGFLKDIHQKSGLTFEQMSGYLNNPANFSEQGWKSIQKRQQELEKNLLKGKKSASIGGGEEKGSSNEQKKRSKAMGPRRNWIPIS